MKARWIIIPTIALMIISARQALTTEAPATEAPVTKMQANQALAPEALAKKSGCFECHSVDKNVVGPGYHNVAERYKGDAKARAALIQTVKKGGKGNWSEISRGVPMPPHSGRLSDADITRLVDWVLSLQPKEK
jgi:cytochrome c551/c552